MKVLFINAVCGTGSTGKICAELAEKFEAEGHEVKIAYGRDGFVPEKYQKYAVRIGNDTDVKLHALKNRITDKHGLYSKKPTREFLKWAEEYSPDLLWLHNIHGYYINYEMLFDWIKSRPNMQVKWTLHDCWTFTGHCPHFMVAKCDKWKTQCEKCPQTKRYPATYAFDNSKQNYLRKKSAFTGVKDMTLITPSKWLADLVKQSFLKEYNVEVVYNTIDTSVFKPTESDFREKNGLVNKKIILGVASTWDQYKGLYDFYKLRELLDDNYAIILVGLNDKQLSELPEGIIGIKRTNSREELAAIYTAADVLVNPSREETFGMTVIEALSCGTQAIVYKDTACEEIVQKYGGVAVEPEADKVVEEIRNLIGV